MIYIFEIFVNAFWDRFRWDGVFFTCTGLLSYADLIEKFQSVIPAVISGSYWISEC